MNDWKKPTQHSMKRRAPWHNYRRPGVYMLTLVVEGRRPLFGRLVTEPVPRVELSALGEKILKEEMPKITQHYPNIAVWKACVMPDHLHMIIHVTDWIREGKSLGTVVAGFKYGCSKAYLSALPVGQSVQPPLPAFQKQVPPQSPPLFEKGYNDRLLLADGQLDRWKHYLDDNPRRLALKRLHPNLFTVMHGRKIGSWECQMVGNIFLLDIPDKVAVIVHRADSEEVFAQKKAVWLACGERGGVIVSAAIAKREKAVMREAMERGYSLILLKENGFPELYKPSGEAFNACARGQLLQVSPWPYHMEQKTISRAQCLELNRLAEEITTGPASETQGTGA